jgi:hypothetical protein
MSVSLGQPYELGAKPGPLPILPTSSFSDVTYNWHYNLEHINGLKSLPVGVCAGSQRCSRLQLCTWVLGEICHH